nr:retrovirus-related Pol polyprotein from transposon TNT 1-94 [Tanacetum cinerariifolium]
MAGSSSTQTAKPFQSKNKGHVAERFDWDEEDVFDDEELVQFKVLMALADDVLVVGKNHARNDKWIDITMRKGASPSLEVNPLTYLEHYPKGRPGLRAVEHTKPDIQDFASKGISGPVTIKTLNESVLQFLLRLKSIKKSLK